MQDTFQCKVGQKVLAPWEPQWLYPGTIVFIYESPDLAMGPIALIDFDDGDFGAALLQDLRSLGSIRVGDIVQVRRNQTATKIYEPAKVTAIDGEDISVLCIDGYEERTTIAYIRVPFRQRVDHRAQFSVN